MHYGLAPQVIQDKVEVDLVKDKVEMCIYQYLPIKMAGALENFHIPQNLEWIKRFIPHLSFCPHTDFIYVSAKHQFVTPDNMGNRPGWHSDGFGSDDINYIWSDSFPTQFALQEFQISEDHVKSLKELQDQVKDECITEYGVGAFIRIDRWNIHRPPVAGAGFRTFLKFSISKNRYNLQGNSHNYLMNYDWEMLPRSEVRNHPTAVIEPLVPANLTKVVMSGFEEKLRVMVKKANSTDIKLSSDGSIALSFHQIMKMFVNLKVDSIPLRHTFVPFASFPPEEYLTLEYQLRKMVAASHGAHYADKAFATGRVVNQLVKSGIFAITHESSVVWSDGVSSLKEGEVAPKVFGRKVKSLAWSTFIQEYDKALIEMKAFNEPPESTPPGQHNPLNTLIQFTSARKSMGFIVKDLVAEFIKKGVVEVPIGASADAYADMELGDKTVTVEFMLRNLLLKRYPESSGYRNVMTATNKVIADLVATKLFVETKGRSAVPFPSLTANRPAKQYPVAIRDVKCLRMVDWNATQQ